MLSFTDLGYIEAQKYMAGCLLLVIWLPAISAVSFTLARSRRQLPFRVFAAGTGFSLPVYFLAAQAMSLETGFGAATQPSLSLGASLPVTGGYFGFEMTAILIQIGMSIFFVLGLSVYAWALARFFRFVLGRLEKLFAPENV